MKTTTFAVLARLTDSEEPVWISRIGKKGLVHTPVINKVFGSRSSAMGTAENVAALDNVTDVAIVPIKLQPALNDSTVVLDSSYEGPAEEGEAEEPLDLGAVFG